MPSQTRSYRALLAGFLSVTLFAALNVCAGSLRQLPGHRPPAESLAQPLGSVPETDRLQLAISLPLRNTGALSNLLERLYDPTSPDYHHYLTPAQFTEQFGPTADDYQKVVQFAQSNGFEILNQRESRMLLDVRATVSNVQKTFHVHLNHYQHPTESRRFYAPDATPAVDGALPILDVRGLDSFASAHSMLHARRAPAKAFPESGSASGGYYQGTDFRHAYAPGVTLNGTGQMVGLLELDGYYSNDIVTYESIAGLPNVPLINVNVSNAPAIPSDGVIEVSLDIEMAIAMAPGLSAVVVFEAGGTNVVGDFEDILDSMSTSNQIKQFSSSWAFTGTPDPDTVMDGWLQKMQTQGQSFYQASGDGDAWVFPIATPCDSPYVISVGGTSLAMNSNGVSYASETVWNEGNQGSGNGWAPNEGTGRHQNDNIGSAGGVSGVYLTLPSWQTNVINSTNKGSTSARNIPDVAMTASNIFVVASNGLEWVVGGTSCAAPLWAGFTALINQQAAATGASTVGFINPAIYALGRGPSYTSVFHDITVGNNTNKLSTNRYPATVGYDLCTGWGSPNGAALINALVPLGLQVLPATGFTSTGPFAGPFSPTNQTFVLTNANATSFNWSLVNTSSWLAASVSNGALAASSSVSVNIGLTAAAAGLAPGSYTNAIVFTNTTSGGAQGVPFGLTVSQAAPGLAWTAPAGITYGHALSGVQLDATAGVPGTFVYTPSNGVILTAGSHTLSVAFSPSNSTDYTGASSNVAISVAPAPLTVTVGNASRLYGASNPPFTGQILGLTNSDNITATYASSASSNSPVGTYAIVPTLVDPGNRRTNYSLTLSNGTLTVLQAAPVLNWPAPAPVIYGTSLGTNQLNATASTPGSFAYNPPPGAELPVGTNILSVQFNPSDSTDYTNATATISLIVQPAPLTVTASNASQTYGQSPPIFGGTISGVTNGDNITATFTSGTSSNSPVGTYAIVPTLVDPGNLATNYIVTLSNGTLSINPATPILNWPAPTPITYGTPLDSNQLNAAATVPGIFIYTPTAGTILGPGTNTLSVSFTADDTTNYTGAGTNVELLVSLVPIPLTIQLVNNSVVLSWDDPLAVFSLQAAPSPAGVFTNIPDATSPFTNDLSASQLFFQLAAPPD
jgi:hypothetical protein